MRRFGEMREGGERLSLVLCESSEHSIWRVRLRFGDRTIVVGVDEDTDEVVISDDVPARDEIIDVSDSEPWRSAIGKPIFDAWEMVNLNGHKDALQLHFAENVNSPAVILQLQGVASTIRVFVI